MFIKLATALERHKYLRGQYKGDAPADPSRRSRNHIRITKHADSLRVRMFNTDIITAYPDGSIRIDMRGWLRSTTFATLNDAFKAHGTGPRMYIGSKSLFSISQLCLFVGDKTYRYYDGMTFDGEGVLTSPQMPFQAKRISKAETKELADDIKSSGFKDMFPLLYATCQPSDNRMYVTSSSLIDILTVEYHANKWSELVATYKYSNDWGWHGGVHTRKQEEVGNAGTCWSSIMNVAKTGMYHIVDSTTTELITGVKPTFSPANPV